MKTVILYDTQDISHECLLLEDALKLEAQNDILKRQMNEIAYICSYGWTDGSIQANCKRIYELACYL